MQRKHDKVAQLLPSDQKHNAEDLPDVDFIAEYAALAYAESVLSSFPGITLESLEHAPSPSAFALAALCAKESFLPPSLTLSANTTKPPLSLRLARTRTDWDKWEEAMQYEVESLEQKGVFERVP